MNAEPMSWLINLVAWMVFAGLVSFLVALLPVVKIGFSRVSIRRPALPPGEPLSERAHEIKTRIPESFFEKPSTWGWRRLLGVSLGLLFGVALVPVLLGVAAAWMIIWAVHRLKVFHAIGSRWLRKWNVPLPSVVAWPSLPVLWVSRAWRERA